MSQSPSKPEQVNTSDPKKPAAKGGKAGDVVVEEELVSILWPRSDNLTLTIEHGRPVTQREDGAFD